MADNDQWHYTDKTGQQAGPVPKDELLKLISSGAVPRSAMTWTNGMANWQPVSQVPELKIKTERPTHPPAPTPAQSPSPTQQTTEAPASPAPAPEEQINPYETPESTIQFDDVPEVALSYAELNGITPTYDGIGRLSYIILKPLLYSVIFIPLAFLFAYLESQLLVNITLAVFAFFLIRINCQRFTNIGYTPWLTLGLLVPVLNYLINIILVCLPPGYAHHKKLDIPAYILGILMLIPIGLIIAITFFGAFASVIHEFSNFNFKSN